MLYLINATGKTRDNTIWEPTSVQFADNGNPAVKSYRKNKGIKKQSMAAWKKVLRAIDREHEQSRRVDGVFLSGKPNYCIGIAKQCFMSRVNVFVPITTPFPQDEITDGTVFRPMGVRWIKPIHFAVERPMYYVAEKMIVFSRCKMLKETKEELEFYSQMDCADWCVVKDPSPDLPDATAEKDLQEFAEIYTSRISGLGFAICFYDATVETALNIWVAAKNKSIPCFFAFQDWNDSGDRKELKRVEVIPF